MNKSISFPLLFEFQNICCKIQNQRSNVITKVAVDTPMFQEIWRTWEILFYGLNMNIGYVCDNISYYREQDTAFHILQVRGEKLPECRGSNSEYRFSL